MYGYHFYQDQQLVVYLKTIKHRVILFDIIYRNLKPFSSYLHHYIIMRIKLVPLILKLSYVILETNLHIAHSDMEK